MDKNSKKEFDKEQHSETKDSQKITLSKEELHQKNLEDLVEEIKLLRAEIKKNTKAFHPRYRILAGIATGFGGVIGATLVVSLTVYLIKPFASIDLLKPFVNEIIKIVQGQRETSESKVEEKFNTPRGDLNSKRK